MTELLHLFTSITANYLPKARVLAHTAKAQAWPVKFHLLLSDDYPATADPAREPFDSIIPITELPIADFEPWVFGHTVVELCTAVKGMGFQTIAHRYNAEKILYFDPDMAVFSSLAPLAEALDHASIILTPHQTEPESEFEAIIDNEICSLKHGVYNLGFLGVRTSSEGLRFIDWWTQRLQHFCHDDIAGGLFTDQRWMDLAPAFFSDLNILRYPGCNVATWNLTHRHAAGDLATGITINGQPLCFYHFSGFDGGAQAVMLNKYAPRGSVLFDLRQWYIEQCQQQGQDTLGQTPCRYAYYDNGEPITRAQRVLYRSRPDLQKAYPQPLQTTGDSYYQWFKHHADDPSHLELDNVTRQELMDARRELDLIKRSRSWRVSRQLARIWNAFR